MTHEDARKALAGLFVATGEVPEDWAGLLADLTIAAVTPAAPPPPPPRRRWFGR